MCRFLLLVLLSCSVIASQAQSTVLGLYRDDSAPYPDFSILAHIDPIDGNIIQLDTVQGINSVILGSSSFNQLDGLYTFRGGAGNAWQTVSVDIGSGDYVTTTFPQVTMNGIEQDMASGLAYGLGFIISNDDPFMPEYETTLLRWNIQTGETTVVDTIAQVNGLIAGATTFNPFTGTYYCFGNDQNGVTNIFGIQVLDGSISLQVPLDLEEDEYVNELELDLLTGNSYLIHRNNGDMFFSSIDLATGAITDLLDLTDEVPYWSPDAVVYHQETGRFIMLTFDDNFQEHILTVDANTASILSQVPIDYNIIELEVDNIEFAVAQFVSVDDVEELSSEYDLVIGSDHVRIDGLDREQVIPYQLLDSSGRLMGRGQLDGMGRAEISKLTSGIYFLRWQMDSIVLTKRFLKSR